MAYEVLTGYTETDPNSHITVTTNKAEFAALQRNEKAYVNKDFGSGAFSGDFAHTFSFRITGFSSTSDVGIYAVSNDGDDGWAGLSDGFFVYVNYTGATSFKLTLKEVGGNSVQHSHTLYHNNTYTFEVRREGTTAYLNRVGVHEVSMSCGTDSYQYFYAMLSRNSAITTNDADGYVENIDLGLPESIELADTLNLSDSIALNVSQENLLLNDTLNLSDEILLDVSKEKVYLEDTLNLSDEILADLSLEEVELNDTLNFSDEILLNVSKEKIELADTLSLSDEVLAGAFSKNASRVIYVGSNTLIIITDTDPANIIEVDISGGAPVFDVYEMSASGETYKNAKDVSFNDNFDKLYVACADGLVAKVDSTNLDSREEISVSDTDDLTTIADAEEFYKVFTGTDNSSAELYEIDEGTMSSINSDFRMRIPSEETFDTVLTYIETGKITADFRYLAETTNKISTDFRYLDTPYDEIELTPLYGSGFTVDINSSQADDVLLNTIQVRWVAEEVSTAQFVLRRYHDKLNYTMEGVSSEITNKNDVVIKINDQEVFTGKIDTLDCSGKDEYVIVYCIGTVRNPNYITKNLTLPSINEQLHPYHVLDNQVNIKKYVTDYDDEDNPSLYKGIKIDLGTKEEESVSKWIDVSNMSVLAEKIEEGEWRPQTNWTYFFWANAKLLDPFSATYSRIFYNRYIGTSLGGLSDDLWQLIGANYRYQRVFDNIVTELGYYYKGSAPYKEVSAKNGKYIAKTRWEDREDGFYLVTNKYWDYTDYTKKIADIEYEKIKDSNGIAPGDANYAETIANITLTIDGFLYYGLGLLTKINVTNTTESGIYEDNNGFPLRIKTLTIDSLTMKVTITADNKKTEAELEDLENSVYPDEPEPIEESAVRLYTKFDPNTYSDVE